MAENNTRLYLYGALLIGGIVIISKLGNIFNFGGSPAPSITNGLNPVFTENETNKRKYRYTLSSDKYDELQEDIYDAIGVFSDDYASVMDALKQCNTQGDVYGIAKFFSQQHNKDLWTFLSTGTGITPLDGLSNSHLNAINDFVNSLPLV